MFYNNVLTVSPGKAESISIKAEYISGGVPSKNLPHPPLNSVSPEIYIIFLINP